MQRGTTRPALYRKGKVGNQTRDPMSAASRGQHRGDGKSHRQPRDTVRVSVTVSLCIISPSGIVECDLQLSLTKQRLICRGGRNPLRSLRREVCVAVWIFFILFYLFVTRYAYPWRRVCAIWVGDRTVANARRLLIVFSGFFFSSSADGWLVGWLLSSVP